MPDPLLVGLDVHHKTQSVCVMNVLGAIIDDKLTVHNTPAGAAAFEDGVAKSSGRPGRS